jgi:hypothetical protein
MMELVGWRKKLRCVSDRSEFPTVSRIFSILVQKICDEERKIGKEQKRMNPQWASAEEVNQLSLLLRQVHHTNTHSQERKFIFLLSDKESQKVSAEENQWELRGNVSLWLGFWDFGGSLAAD